MTYDLEFIFYQIIMPILIFVVIIIILVLQGLRNNPLDLNKLFFKRKRIASEECE